MLNNECPACFVFVFRNFTIAKTTTRATAKNHTNSLDLEHGRSVARTLPLVLYPRLLLVVLLLLRQTWLIIWFDIMILPVTFTATLLILIVTELGLISIGMLVGWSMNFFFAKAISDASFTVFCLFAVWVCLLLFSFVCVLVGEISIDFQRARKAKGKGKRERREGVSIHAVNDGYH